MANNTINQLPLALTIDPIADLLPIFTSSTTATQAISRNTYLGITGSPIGTTDVQSLSNKTLGNTNTITVKDSLMTLQNTADLTKQAKFSLASITTGNIRTYTLPDITDTIVTLGATQTLTAKTLTSPLINSILDVNGNSWIAQTATASAVNQVTLANAATGNGPIISPTGTDTNVDLNIVAGKGTGKLKIAGRYDGWTTGTVAPSSVTALGNRSYSCVFNSTDLTGYLSNGMRMMFTRTVAAPTQSTSLNGTTQYYSKTSPAGMTFTNNFVVSAWVKLSSYAAGGIASRTDGTNGWQVYVTASGQIAVTGFNGGAGNYKLVTTYQSLPLNKWVHIATQTDMSVLTLSPTVNYMMIDGVDVPAYISQSGTNPTSLVQAGSLNIGALNGTNFFPGKIAQVAIYSAKVPEATILASSTQTLVGTETSLISAYSFNNSINDLNANANNLTANGSAVATATDSPFAQGATAGTLEYGIVTSNSFSTNTTLTVQVPEGCAIPTSGGVSAVSYSTQAVPYGFPKDLDKWTLLSLYQQVISQASPVQNTWYNAGQLNLPVGAWQHGTKTTLYGYRSVAGASSALLSMSSANNTEGDVNYTSRVYGSSTSEVASYIHQRVPFNTTSQVIRYANIKTDQLGMTTLQFNQSPAVIYAENAYL